MKIRLAGVEMIHADGLTDRRNEASSCFPQFCELASKPMNYREIITVCSAIHTKHINTYALSTEYRL
jgi:undecaprenyl pyrophosphate synthase